MILAFLLTAHLDVTLLFMSLTLTALLIPAMGQWQSFSLISLSQMAIHGNSSYTFSLSKDGIDCAAALRCPDLAVFLSCFDDEAIGKCLVFPGLSKHNFFLAV